MVKDTHQQTIHVVMKYEMKEITKNKQLSTDFHAVGGDYQFEIRILTTGQVFMSDSV